MIVILTFVSKNLIAVSVAVLPLNVSWKKCFETAVQNGADGVELMGGVRGWWNRGLTGLPVISMHQPAEEILGLFVSRSNQRRARIWTDKYVIHPPLSRFYSDEKYFDMMQHWAGMEKMTIMLENMPPRYASWWVAAFGTTAAKWTDVEVVATECRKRNWKMTLDTSHWQRIEPEEESLKKILPVMANIHISDWKGEKQHMSLGQGVMDVEAWMKWIAKNYAGQVTLELTPKYWVNPNRYLKEMAESLKIMRQWLKD